ncbi:CRISPR-associated endonuclease Cas2 [Fervidobacterium riparium]|uniref:CRISPR-associated endoribonuclease Cas2 n=1 Tax=Fervidobacterium gondwanense DSM 13020 TaxID=1121883 RepID=A0A1M7TG73_FERGO|nr:CRISPR-associated endonuclease Cas2 [Fervidobacterium gondwanense]SHN69720.1 CRISPR-associated protein, Cas2 family [Fervidobacterium gondwanense DSM 13020]
MFYVVSYDIVDDKRRRHVAKYLESYGVRVQYSVFETELNEQQLSSMIKGLKKKIKKSEDTIRIYAIPKEFREKILTIGTDKGSFYDKDIYIV